MTDADREASLEEMAEALVGAWACEGPIPDIQHDNIALTRLLVVAALEYEGIPLRFMPWLVPLAHAIAGLVAKHRIDWSVEECVRVMTLNAPWALKARMAESCAAEGVPPEYARKTVNIIWSVYFCALDAHSSSIGTFVDQINGRASGARLLNVPLLAKRAYRQLAADLKAYGTDLPQ